MGRYINVQHDIFSIFASAAWTNIGVKAYPQNTIPVNPGNEYFRVSIIPRGHSLNRKSISGIIIIDIFCVAGNGTKRLFELADILDNFFNSKQLSTNSDAVTQFLNSSLEDSGKDPDNSMLYRAIYSIPFNYFGVL